MARNAKNAADWRTHAAAPFICEKRPATGAKGMVVTNHPLASAAATEILAGGGNAIDAAIAALFTLTTVEPMMVGILGGGIAHIRLADGNHFVVDGQSQAPLATGPSTFTPDPDARPGSLDAVGRKNALGRSAVATPGNLLSWGLTLTRFGTMDILDVMRAAIRHAGVGFRVTPYLAECVNDCAADLALDPEISKLFLPGGMPIKAGEKLVNGDYAETLIHIAREGTSTLYNGVLGRRYTDDMVAHGGYITYQDLFRYRPIFRDTIFGLYRGYEIVGPPPPSSGPAHIIQMLNILEGYDIAKMGFGSADHAHVMAEALKIAFADRRAAMGDPDFVDVPLGKILDKAYAKSRQKKIKLKRAQRWSAEVAAGLGEHHTTHLTVADAEGNVVSTTQTINSLFGARYMVPGTGMIPNNYMYLFEPKPGSANSVAPGKRVTSSMSPVIVLRDGYPVWTVGLPGGMRIFPSVFQALVNLIDFGMSIQEAAEAPRIWTQGYQLEIEGGFPDAVVEDLRGRGHDVARVGNVGGGMSIIRFQEDGMMEGASCWRADGTPIGIGGGLARPGVRFRPEATSV